MGHSHAREKETMLHLTNRRICPNHLHTMSPPNPMGHSHTREKCKSMLQGLQQAWSGLKTSSRYCNKSWLLPAGPHQSPSLSSTSQANTHTKTMFCESTSLVVTSRKPSQPNKNCLWVTFRIQTNHSTWSWRNDCGSPKLGTNEISPFLRIKVASWTSWKIKTTKGHWRSNQSWQPQRCSLTRWTPSKAGGRQCHARFYSPTLNQ